MKKIIKMAIAILLGIMICFGNSFPASAHPIKDGSFEAIIYSLKGAINNQDIDLYISFFSKENQSLMEEYVEKKGGDSFFAIKNVEIISMELTDLPVPEKNDSKFEDAVVYRVTENVIYKENHGRNTYDLISGETTKDFVFVLENGEWKIERISDANFGAKSSNLSEPIETFIYFTKAGNIAFYGNGTSGIYFDNYLKDVLPNEWYISYYSSYPQYGYASAMASKMYAWYYTVHPKWDFDPYYACMKDNSSDQNYLIWSHDNLSSTYKTAEDNVLSFISGKAMVSSNNNTVFEVHYHATSGSYHSGQMSASGCLSLAQSGQTYANILHYYYDNSSYIGNSNTANIVTY